MNRFTVKECQEVYDRHGIDSFDHTGLTTDLCMVIAEQDEIIKELSSLCEKDGGGHLFSAEEIVDIIRESLERKRNDADKEAQEG